jgi:hypothetical protein
VEKLNILVQFLFWCFGGGGFDGKQIIIGNGFIMQSARVCNLFFLALKRCGEVEVLSLNLGVKFLFL